jgi:hypothetical protein
MQFLVVILAAFVAYAFGAFWYIYMSKPWMAAAGIPMDAKGKPTGNGGAMPFVIGFAATLLVAGMMRHIFVQSHLGTVALGAMGGFGIGAFLITPWVLMNYSFAGRPFKLTLIDGTNSVVGCTLMGIIFGAFGV